MGEQSYEVSAVDGIEAGLSGERQTVFVSVAQRTWRGEGNYLREPVYAEGKETAERVVREQAD